MTAVRLSACDPCSFAVPEECQLKHIDLHLDVDFDKQILTGSVNLQLEKKNDKVDCVVLDTRDITIKSITDQSTGQVLSYKLGEPVLSFGSKLEIILPSTPDNRCVISIEYETSPKCTALQWLNKEQTAGGRQPYLFSQCQAIHCRSMIPCQDTPAVKCTYSAKISAVKEITILMSAIRAGTEPHGTDSSKLIHNFKQDVPIPSYLIAIVGGDLESRDIGPRSKVWSEKEAVELAEYEFGETESMLQTAEELMGPYVWGQYDLLVLPPSFPYGGMENPCLTFVTPTLLAGDRSLADVVAHEITHSWMGNLVTNANFEHFWLNEGHTVFVERKIAGRLAEKRLGGDKNKGEAMRNFKSISGWNDLQECIGVLKSGPYTKLVPDLEGVDPDDAFSSIPYEKGSAFLFYLESLVGGPAVFEPFLKAYVEKFQGKSLVTSDWKEFLLHYFKDTEAASKLNEVDWESWLYGLGSPPVKPKYDDSLVEPCAKVCQRWVQSNEDELLKSASDDLKFSESTQMREFLALLLKEEALPLTKIKAMEQFYSLNAVQNSEIRFKWLRLCIRAKAEDCIPLALDFVNKQGRMKFVRPIYRDLYAWEKSREKAVENFKTKRPQMHNTTATLVAKDLELA